MQRRKLVQFLATSVPAIALLGEYKILEVFQEQKWVSFKITFNEATDKNTYLSNRKLNPLWTRWDQAENSFFNQKIIVEKKFTFDPKFVELKYRFSDEKQLSAYLNSVKKEFPEIFNGTYSLEQNKISSKVIA